MKHYKLWSGRVIREDEVIREFVTQDWDTYGELELMKRQIERLTELAAKNASQSTFDWAVENMSLIEVQKEKF
jgi:hypothetical protein